MNNEKGYTYAGTLMAILIIGSVYLLLMYTGFATDTLDSSKSREVTDELVKDLNGKERIHSALSSNVSLEGTIEYQDIEKEFEISTINEKFEKQNLSFGNGGSFYINNRTDVEVSFYATPLNEEDSCFVSSSITNGSYDLLGGQGSNIGNNGGFIINGDKLYNKETGETHYGTYTVNVNSNCSVSTNISYDKLTERDVLLKTSAYERNVKINNKNNVEVKFN